MQNIAIFDIGKTNKKAFVFDEDYRILFEKTTQLPETVDEDGFSCEDLSLLENWIHETALEIKNEPHFQIKAVNCTAYGASFVHLGDDLRPVTPLYNYLKPFPQGLLDVFLKPYGGADQIALETASPLLGSLNSGLQLYRLKKEKPRVYEKISYTLHLPQWVYFLISGGKIPGPDLTSIGCHTLLWDFQKKDYHHWVKTEGLIKKFPPIADYSCGLHDSSAALLPYLKTFDEPFVLISTGTWCISLNPFNDEPLTADELKQDCLCYLTRDGQPIKAARYFGGNEHEQAVHRLAAKYEVSPDFYKKEGLRADQENLTGLPEALEDYAGFMRELVKKQAASTRLAIGKTPVHRIFVDGGFSQNPLYMNLLAEAFPDIEVAASEVAQATALGAALAIHRDWNPKGLPAGLVKFVARP